MPSTSNDTPLPSDLWHQAHMENPGSEYGRRMRYIELMVEYGYVIDGDEGAPDA